MPYRLELLNVPFCVYPQKDCLLLKRNQALYYQNVYGIEVYLQIKNFEGLGTNLDIEKTGATLGVLCHIYPKFILGTC